MKKILTFLFILCLFGLPDSAMSLTADDMCNKGTTGEDGSIKTDRQIIQADMASASLLAQEAISAKRASIGMQDARDKVTSLYSNCMSSLNSMVQGIVGAAQQFKSLDYTSVLSGAARSAADKALNTACQKVSEMTTAQINAAVQSLDPNGYAGSIKSALNDAEYYQGYRGQYFTSGVGSSWTPSTPTTTSPTEATRSMTDGIRSSGKLANSN